MIIQNNRGMLSSICKYMCSELRKFGPTDLGLLMSRSSRALFVIPFLQQWNLVDVVYIKNFQKHLGDQNEKRKTK